MRRPTLLLGVLAMLVSAGAHANFLAGSVNLAPIGSTGSFKSSGWAQFYNDLQMPAAATLSGTHTVTGPQHFTHQVTGTDGNYYYDLEGPADPGACYSTSLTVNAVPAGPGSDAQDSWFGPESRCADPPTRPGYIEVPACPTSPILINLHDGSFPLSGVEAPVWFDIDADGQVNRITWTAADSAVAFLARDRNGNGLIDDGSELFGNATLLHSGVRASNGFEALVELDANGDGLVSALDGEAWSVLLLWTDSDHDGVSQAGEIQSVAGSSVDAIETEYRWTGRRDAAGNLYAYQGRAYLDRARRPIYDVFFGLVP